MQGGCLCYETAPSVYFRFLFIQAIEAIVGIPIGHTSVQDRDYEQFLPKCAPYIPAMSFDFDWFLAATR